MRLIRQKITIINIRKPQIHNINDKLKWFGNSLGLFNLRDKDKSCYRIFIELLKSSRKATPLSSDQLAERLNLSRGTVIHHLSKLMESGIVVHEGNKYLLRVDNLKDLISEVEKDLKRMTDDLKDVAQDIDKWLGM
ncbi:MAG: winged helix-turn-helix domain-containing protein [Candidatus Woesearchaeota archaeon]